MKDLRDEIALESLKIIMDKGLDLDNWKLEEMGHWAADSYNMADAMLKAREGEEEK